MAKTKRKSGEIKAIMQENKLGLVSILIPVYNAEKYLSQCLNSVLGQTYSNLEIIAVNDGSQDRSLAILQEFEKKDSRIKVFNQQNSGVSNARNFALAKATGEYVLFIDSDDFIEKDMVETLVDCLAKNENCDIVLCKNDITMEGEPVNAHKDSGDFEIWDRDRQIYEFLRHKRINGALYTKLIRLSVCKNYKFDPEVGFGEDAQWLFKVISNCNNMFVLDKTLYHHVLQGESISFKPYSSKKFSSIKVWREIEREILENYPQWKSLVKERLLCSATYLLYEMKKSKVKNKDEKKVLKKVVRQNIGVIFSKNEMTNKMKLYAVICAVSM